MIILRNVLALLAGLVAGSAVNMAIVSLGPSLIPPPPGVDVSSVEGLKQTIHLFEPRHFVVPFLAHAVGAFAGALTGFLIAAHSRARIAYALGVIFLAGGVAASLMIPAPAWFIALDLIVAYLPMAWLAVRVGTRLKGEESASRP